ncbi:MAG: protein kinase [Mariniblastus sp.]
MPEQKEKCFDQQAFTRFLEEKTEIGEEARIVAHIGDCKKCQDLLEQLSGQEKVWNDIQEHFAEHDFDSDIDETLDSDGRTQQRDLRKVQDMLAPTDNPEMMGRLGGYEICGVIGRGSAGIVVKALDTRLNRFVAIKMLAPAYSNNGCSRRRFEREGRAIASVKDPHVVPIHTVDEFQGTPYIVMQYMPDGSLNQRIQKHGPLETKQIACIGMQIAKGLAAAHKRGIVHRDVKPANVLLENGIDGAMVTDFGLARVVDEATMTRSGSISGTPQFMSPEQAMGERVDPRSDLFSLGSVMYAACTGHAPFKSQSVFGVIKKVCEGEPKPILEMNSDIAPWMVSLIARLHSKAPKDRFESADAVAELLSKELAHIESPTMVAQPQRDWWIKKQQPAKPNRTTARRIGLAAAVAGIVGISAFSMSGFLGFGDGVEKNNDTQLVSSTEKSGLVQEPDLNGTIASALGSVSSSVPTMGGMMEMALSENEKLPKFENSIETTIDVQPGGQLFFRSNLGALDVVTHDKNTVEMKLIHQVRANDKKTATRLFNALKLDYESGNKEATEVDLEEKRDAVIIAKFPTKKLSDEEIEKAGSLEELKNALLVRSNSHYSNARFEIRIPKTFNIDLQTAAGPIDTEDIDGFAKLVSHGGSLRVGNVSGMANLNTHGGKIVIGNVGKDAKLLSHGGSITAQNVGGKFDAESHGGYIVAQKIAANAIAETHGGRVRLDHVVGEVIAESHGGSVTVLKAEEGVDLSAKAGSITVNFVGQPTKDSKLVSGVGSIRVGYLENVGLNINADCKLGKVSGPFVEQKTKTLQHQLNNGEVGLKAESGNGSIKFNVIDVAEIDKKIEIENERDLGQRTFQRAYDLHMDGKIDRALKGHIEAAKFKQFKGIATYNIGCAWSLKGDQDKAFQALNEAIDYGFNDVSQFTEDSDLDSLRKDERFKKIMKRLGESEDEEGAEDVSLKNSKQKNCQSCSAI